MGKLYFKKADVERVLEGLSPEDDVMLVGDQGVYLMSFRAPVEGRPLAYADGIDPSKNDDWWEKKRAIFGGDDGGDAIGSAKRLRKILTLVKTFLVVVLTKDSIETMND